MAIKFGVSSSELSTFVQENKKRKGNAQQSAPAAVAFVPAEGGTHTGTAASSAAGDVGAAAPVPASQVIGGGSGGDDPFKEQAANVE